LAFFGATATPKRQRPAFEEYETLLKRHIVDNPLLSGVPERDRRIFYAFLRARLGQRYFSQVNRRRNQKKK